MLISSVQMLVSMLYWCVVLGYGVDSLLEMAQASHEKKQKIDDEEYGLNGAAETAAIDLIRPSPPSTSSSPSASPSTAPLLVTPKRKRLDETKSADSKEKELRSVLIDQ